MMNNILFVCVGNICRSPMAEGLLKQRLPEKAVYSAGINAVIGAPADRMAVRIMREQGIEIGGHCARSLGAWMVDGADVILTMDQDQKRFIQLRYPESKNKVFRLGEFADYDVPDPFHQSLAVFRESHDLIARGVDELVLRIAHVAGERSRKEPSAIRHLPEARL